MTRPAFEIPAARRRSTQPDGTIAVTDPQHATSARRHVIVRGDVQGVGFRYWTQQQALRRGIEGFVRNRRDGTVEAMIAGPPHVVAEMLRALRQGPSGARVDAVEEIADAAGAAAEPRRGERFSMLPTI